MSGRCGGGGAGGEEAEAEDKWAVGGAAGTGRGAVGGLKGGAEEC